MQDLPMQLARSLLPPLSRWFVFCSALASFSCSDGSSAGLHPVRGTVVYKNEAAVGALVTFHSKTGNSITTVPPTGLVGKDGTFTVTTGNGKGAPAGEYI